MENKDVWAFPGLSAEQVTTDPFERKFYARDLAPIPELLSKLLFKNLPDCVVRPMTAQDVAGVMVKAYAEQTPVTPRAGGTTAFLNAVPVQGGVVLDLTGLKGISQIDRENLTAEVWSGTSWKELRQGLAEFGLTTCSEPSSGESSTVGGWFNMEGYGIGSAAYGCFHNQVKHVQAVLADGRIIESTKDNCYPLHWFAGSEGTLGVTTKLTVQVRAIPEQELHLAVEYAGAAQVQEALTRLQSLPGAEAPYNVHWSNPDFSAMLARFGYATPSRQHVVTISYQGESTIVKQGEQTITAIALATGGKVLPREAGLHEWQERFRSLRIKRGGPTLLAAEVLLPVNRLAAFVQAVKKLKQKAAVYGHQLDNSQILIMIMFYADETRLLEYLFLLAKTKLLYDAALKLGGRPYGIGVWNAVYYARAYPAGERSARWERKKLLDPRNILNPGKIYTTPALLPPAAFGLGTAGANLLSSILQIGGGR